MVDAEADDVANLVLVEVPFDRRDQGDRPDRRSPLGDQALQTSYRP
jgi:hypothetical protein